MSAARLRTFVLTAALAWVLAACGSAASQNPAPSDGDSQETPEAENEAERETEAPDLDRESESSPEIENEADSADGDESESESESDTSDPDEQEFILIDGDTEDDLPSCGEVPLAKCFDHAPAGREGTACDGTLLLLCKPSVPSYPVCTSTCKCTGSQSCAELCIDTGLEGLAYCGSNPTDGDLDETDGESEAPDDGDAELDEETPDTDADSTELDEIVVDSDTDQAESEEEPACTPDAFENGGNDSFSARQPIDWGTTPDLTLCPDDRDWYAVTLAPGETLDARITIQQGPRAFLVLYDEAMNDLTQAAYPDLVSPSATLTYISQAGGHYALKVFPYVTGEVVAYSLTLSHGAASDGDAADQEETDSETDTPESDADSGEADSDSDLTPICLDDSAEPNDSCATASLITLTPDIRYNVSNLTICPGNTDWYRFAGRNGETFSFRVYFNKPYGALDLNLFGPCGVPLSYAGTYQYFSDAGGKGGIELTYRVLSTNTFTVRIAPKDNPQINTVYDISFLRQSAYTCGDDFDPNLTPGTAANALGSFTDLTLCKASDWFAYDLPAGSGLDFGITFSNDAGNIDLTLFDSDATTVLKSSRSTRDAERLIYNNTSMAAKRVYVQVEPMSYGDLHYALNAKVGGPYCLEDNFEPNNSAAAAALLGAGDYPGLMLCAGLSEEDWYKVALRDNWALSTHFLYQRQTTPMQVMLYTPEEITYGQAPLLYGNFVDDGATIDYSPGVDGDYDSSDTDYPFYYLRVRHTQNVVVSYALSLKVCEEDAYNNNSYERAAYLPLDVPSNSSLTLCAGREDWFYVELSAGETFKASMYYLVDLGDLDLYLYKNPTDLPIASSTTHTSNETVQVTSPAGAASTYYLKVVGVGAAENSYNLSYTIQ